MSGHSKWASIKHQKGVADARRGQLFTKLTREIIVAVRDGGSNPEVNFRLRLAIQKARDNNMPLDNIERSIRKGSGELEGTTLAELVLEGYGPGGTAILVEALTDNRNRTIQEVRNAFTKHGGSLGENGCVAWIFDAKGLIMVKTDDLDADELVLEAIDAGADDVKVESGYVEIFTAPEEMEKVRSTLEQKKIAIASAELAKMPKTTVQLEEKVALQTLKLLDKLEDQDEVQHVASNIDFPDAILEKYQLQVSG
ncbi:MAG: YebC/PmpR family DNA-binding transcriptional regulator [Dehalococcoidales bacterium]|jgi:YebC/PmpR family DNA-binding regulatory protein|nr:YebC/PmpR family DNA-binding transcriptional regulator [Dehalococcoidales bacterium]MDP6576950.1 YebC/PmpR family DNA-binding transcriptional regulator [Dehalococcoidales bacterium]